VFNVTPSVASYVAFYQQHGAISSDEGEIMMNSLSRHVDDVAVRELQAIIRRDKWVIWDAGDDAADRRHLAARRRRARSVAA
jgi:hypothetical protein